MTPFQSCSKCFHFKVWITGGKLSRFTGISYKNINSQSYIYWENFRREIYEDTDGSLSGKGSPTWITPFGPHLNKTLECATS